MNDRKVYKPTVHRRSVRKWFDRAGLLMGNLRLLRVYPGGAAMYTARLYAWNKSLEPAPGIPPTPGNIVAALRETRTYTIDIVSMRLEGQYIILQFMVQ